MERTWKAVKLTNGTYRLYYSVAGGPDQLLATVGSNEKGWKVLPQTTVGKPSRKRWATAEEAVYSKYGAGAAAAIAKPWRATPQGDLLEPEGGV